LSLKETFGFSRGSVIFGLSGRLKMSFHRLKAGGLLD
jgi:hypothetical protein